MANAGFGCSDLILTVALVLALWVPTEMLFRKRQQTAKQTRKASESFPG
jgi:hypothetical protein